MRAFSRGRAAGFSSGGSTRVPATNMGAAPSPPHRSAQRSRPPLPTRRVLSTTSTRSSRSRATPRPRPRCSATACGVQITHVDVTDWISNMRATSTGRASARAAHPVIGRSGGAGEEGGGGGRGVRGGGGETRRLSQRVVEALTAGRASRWATVADRRRRCWLHCCWSLLRSWHLRW